MMGGVGRLFFIVLFLQDLFLFRVNFLFISYNAVRGGLDVLCSL